MRYIKWGIYLFLKSQLLSVWQVCPLVVQVEHWSCTSGLKLFGNLLCPFEDTDEIPTGKAFQFLLVPTPLVQLGDL
jgi:hypothetical protein